MTLFSFAYLLELRKLVQTSLACNYLVAYKQRAGSAAWTAGWQHTLCHMSMNL